MSDGGTSNGGEAPRPLPRWARSLITLWLLIHFGAVVVAPASVAPSSRLIQQVWLVFRPYLQGLYLNHGYHYFAPEPGESTLLAYTIERADGETIEGSIPHRGIQPRLLYHRHFMLTEQMPFVEVDGSSLTADGEGPGEEPSSINPQPSTINQNPSTLNPQPSTLNQSPSTLNPQPSTINQTPPERPPLIENWYRSYARCLLRKYNGVRITLRRVVHYMPTPEMVLDGVTLDNPPSFREQPLGTYRREEL